MTTTALTVSAEPCRHRTSSRLNGAGRALHGQFMTTLIVPQHVAIRDKPRSHSEKR